MSESLDLGASPVNVVEDIITTAGSASFYGSLSVNSDIIAQADVSTVAKNVLAF